MKTPSEARTDTQPVNAPQHTEGDDSAQMETVSWGVVDKSPAYYSRCHRRLIIFQDHDLSRGGIANCYSAWGSHAQLNAADHLRRPLVLVHRILERERVNKTVYLLVGEHVPGYHPERIAS